MPDSSPHGSTDWGSGYTWTERLAAEMERPSGSTGVHLSAEAIEAAAKMMKAGEAQGHSIAARAHDVAFATLRVDAPAIHAAGVEEMRDRIVAWFDDGVKAACEANDADEADRLSRLAHAIANGCAGGIPKD